MRALGWMWTELGVLGRRHFETTLAPLSVERKTGPRARPVARLSSLVAEGGSPEEPTFPIGRTSRGLGLGSAGGLTERAEVAGDALGLSDHGAQTHASFAPPSWLLRATWTEPSPVSQNQPEMSSPTPRPLATSIANGVTESSPVQPQIMRNRFDLLTLLCRSGSTRPPQTKTLMPRRPELRSDPNSYRM